MPKYIFDLCVVNVSKTLLILSYIVSCREVKRKNIPFRVSNTSEAWELTQHQADHIAMSYVHALSKEFVDPHSTKNTIPYYILRK